MIGKAIGAPPERNGAGWIGMAIGGVRITPDLSPDPAEDEDQDTALDDPCGEPEEPEVEEEDE